MTVLTLEHSYDKKSGYIDGTITPPILLSLRQNVEDSEAAAMGMEKVDCSESRNAMGGAYLVV